MPRLQPIRLLLSAVAGWILREQAATIDYRLEENRVLREQLGKRRLRLTDDQRRRLAAKGVAHGRRLLDQIANLVTPDTILRWHRRRIATKWRQHAVDHYVVHYNAERPHLAVGFKVVVARVVKVMRLEGLPIGGPSGG